MNIEVAAIIPTGHKSKLPRTLSWPIGSKAISDALIGVPQFESLTVEFWCWGELGYHATASHRVLQVHCSGRRRDVSDPQTGFTRQNQLAWKISIDAIPRALRRLIETKVVTEALPLILSWLRANAAHPIERKDAHGMVFTFHELEGEIRHKEHSSLEWQTQPPKS